MVDVYDLPSRTKADTRIFSCISTVTNLQWQTWRKPRGVGMCQITCIGGGGGGGGGFSAAAGNPRGGGGGGGSSAITRVLLAAHLIPDTLYVQVGAGGAGVLTGTAGSGVLSYVGVGPDITATNCLVRSGAVGAVGGGSGTAGAAGALGAAGTIAVIAGMPLAGLGIYNMLAGANGAAGGSQAGANGGTGVSGFLNSGGCGGAGTTAANFAGGGFTGTGGEVATLGSVAPPSGTQNGAAGNPFGKIFFNYGGCGGSSSNAGVGGVGGEGSIGAGGAGGGGGTTGGSGGNGGSGLVVIACW